MATKLGVIARSRATKQSRNTTRLRRIGMRWAGNVTDTGARALVTTQSENGIAPTQSPACPRPCGTGRAGGSDANRHGLIGVLPRAADAFRLTGEHPRSRDEPSS